MRNSKLNLTALALATALALGLSAPAFAADTPEDAQAIGRQNLAVFKDVSNAVLGYVNFTVFDDIAASVEGGTVTLTGHVTMPYKKDDIAAARVADLRGQRRGEQDPVLPVSIFDDELRFRIARAIYGNPSFWHYANMAQPPIHIVVKNGHVTLSRRRQQQRRARVGAVAGHRLRRVRREERAEDRRRDEERAGED